MTVTRKAATLSFPSPIPVTKYRGGFWFPHKSSLTVFTTRNTYMLTKCIQQRRVS